MPPEEHERKRGHSRSGSTGDSSGSNGGNSDSGRKEEGTCAAAAHRRDGADVGVGGDTSPPGAARRRAADGGPSPPSPSGCWRRPGRARHALEQGRGATSERGAVVARRGTGCRHPGSGRTS